MNSQTCTPNGTGLERVRYFPRQLITADDMLAEQQYFRQKLRRHNRFLHGWGVVCGLKVSAAPDAEKKYPWRVKVDAGYALGPWGDEIYVDQPVCLDLAGCLDSLGDPCEPGHPPRVVLPPDGTLYVAVRHLECETRPVRIHPLGCACEDTLCEYSRIRDDFEISCLPERPKTTPPVLLCDLVEKKELAPCPPCPESPWLVLAEVKLPELTATASDPTLVEITDKSITNVSRRQLYSTAMLQEQLIACCCEPPRELPPALADVMVRLAGKVTGRAIQYTIEVVNLGPAEAKNVIVKATPPLGMSGGKPFVGDWTSPNEGSTPFVAKLGDLAPNLPPVVLQFTMIAPDPGGTFKCVATVECTTETNKNNNKAEASHFIPANIR